MHDPVVRPRLLLGLVVGVCDVAGGVDGDGQLVPAQVGQGPDVVFDFLQGLFFSLDFAGVARVEIG